MELGGGETIWDTKSSQQLANASLTPPQPVTSAALSRDGAGFDVYLKCHQDQTVQIPLRLFCEEKCLVYICGPSVPLKLLLLYLMMMFLTARLTCFILIHLKAISCFVHPQHCKDHTLNNGQKL